MVYKLNSKVSKLLSLAAMLTTAHVAQATPITVNNFSFETQSVADNLYQNGAITDWVLTTSTGTTAAGVWNPKTPTDSFLTQPLNGNNVAYLNNYANTKLSQQVAPSLSQFSDYTLRVDVFGRKDFANNAHLADVDIYLAANGVKLDWTSVTTGISFASGSRITLDAKFSTGWVPPTGPLTINFTNKGLSADFGQFDFDNVRLDYFIYASPAPDGGSVTWILGLGLGALACFRRSESKK